jgi:hypothetical protein
MFTSPSCYLGGDALASFRIAGGTIIFQEMQDVRELLALPHSGILKSTGLSAKALFNDPELTPIQGQLSI